MGLGWAARGDIGPGTTTWRCNVRKTLTLSKETLRILDDEDLAHVVGGGGGSNRNGKGHGRTGQHGSCKAPDKKKHHSKSCSSN